MFPVNECYTLLRGDGLRRPDFESFEIRESDGANIVKGVFRADTPEASKVSPRPTDVPFNLMVPAGLSASDFHFAVNVPIYYLLRDNPSRLDVDFMPQPPPPPVPVQQEVNWGGVALVVAGLFAAGAVRRAWK
jgi:hypothetical protein